MRDARRPHRAYRPLFARSSAGEEPSTSRCSRRLPPTTPRTPRPSPSGREPPLPEALGQHLRHGPSPVQHGSHDRALEIHLRRALGGFARRLRFLARLRCDCLARVTRFHAAFTLVFPCILTLRAARKFPVRVPSAPLEVPCFSPIPARWLRRESSPYGSTAPHPLLALAWSRRKPRHF